MMYLVHAENRLPLRIMLHAIVAIGASGVGVADRLLNSKAAPRFTCIILAVCGKLCLARRFYVGETSD